jgi:hypothetical protein
LHQLLPACAAVQPLAQPPQIARLQFGTTFCCEQFQQDVSGLGQSRRIEAVGHRCVLEFRISFFRLRDDVGCCALVDAAVIHASIELPGALLQKPSHGEAARQPLIEGGEIIKLEGTHAAAMSRRTME